MRHKSPPSLPVFLYALCGLLLVPALASAAGPIPVFGPETYRRDPGKPVAVTHRFAVRNPDARYTLHLHNGGRDGGPRGERVSSAVVRVNGAVVLAPHRFRPQAETLTAAVDLAADNEISVELRGRPGGLVTLEIVRSPVSGRLGPDGGTLADPGGEWELVVAPGALGEPTELTVTQGVAPPAEIPRGYLPVGDVLHLEPDGLSFSPPLELRIRYPQGELPENGIRERLVVPYYLLDDSTVAEATARFDRAANRAVVELPHFSFTGFLRVGVELVGAGILTHPAIVESIADRVAEALADPPEGQSVEEFLAANADVLEPFLDAVEEILGPDYVADTFPPEVCQGRGCGRVAGCGDARGLEAGSPWPMIGGCPAHPGRSPFLGAQSPTVKWEAAVGTPPLKLSSPLPYLSSPVIAADGTVYVGSRFWLAAVAPDGTVLWQTRPDGSVDKQGGALSTPALAADGTLYAGSVDGHLYSIATDGSEAWRLPTIGPVLSSPVVAPDGTVYVGTGSGEGHGGVLAVAPDGTVLWEVGVGSVTSSPALGVDGTVYFGSDAGSLHAVGPGGAALWSFATGGPVLSSPAVGRDGAVHAGSRDGGLYALEADGTLRWRTELGEPVSTSPALAADGTVLVATHHPKGGRGNLHAVGTDGSLLWSTALPGTPGSPALGADGTLYLAWRSEGNKLCGRGGACPGVAAVSAGGEILWTAPTGAASAVSAPALGDDGTVYVNLDGRLVALGGDARGSEICSNGVDDDGDGLADCADGDCAELVCDDGDACTTLDTCTAGTCTGGRPAACDDGNDCTADACDPAVGCTAAPLADGTACTDDGSPCTEDVCAGGFCFHPALTDGSMCTDDLDPCTEDLCLAGACTHPTVPEDCGGRECGPSPSGCADCGTCGYGYECSGEGRCVLDLPDDLERVSVDSAGNGGDQQSVRPLLSADGRFVAFDSAATNLVPGDTNGTWDVFLHDRLDGTTERVSVSSSGDQGDGYSLLAGLAADAGRVAFESGATDLVAGDTNGTDDLFVHDRGSGETRRVSLGLRDAESTGGIRGAALAAGGDHVAFSSYASDLVVGDTNGVEGLDIFVRDLPGGETTRASVDSAGREGAVHHTPALSADGRFVTFVARGVGPGAAATHDQVFVHDRLTGRTTRESDTAAGEPSSGQARRGSLSADGRYLVFSSWAPDLVSGDTNGLFDVFVRDRWTGAIQRVSVDSSGREADGASFPHFRQTVSDDGRYVLFLSYASDLVPGGDPGSPQLYVHDRRTGDTVRPLLHLDQYSTVGAISGDGRLLAIASKDPLLPDDGNGTWDVYTFTNPLWEPAERDCRDGLDDDGDGSADCADPDCGDHPACLGLEAECGDGIDDDGDGLADCADPDCDARRCGAGTVCLERSCAVPGCGDVSGQQAGAPWAVRGRCPTAAGRSPATGPAAPQVLWTFPADVSVDISSPAVAADGTVYLPSRDGFLYAVSADGSERWRFAAADQVLSSPAVAADGTVYVGSEAGHLHAVAPDGSERWRFTTGGAVVSSPVIAGDGTVHFGSGDGHLYALRPDGSERWRFATGGGVASSPALGLDGTVYVGAYDGHLYAVAPDGSLRWRYATGDVVSSPAVGRDGAVYAGSFDRTVYALEPDGTLRWRFVHSVAGPFISSPALGADGTVYIGGDDGRLWAIGPGGALRWTFLTSGPVKPTPRVDADGTVYAASIDGTLYAVHPDGSERWRFEAWRHWPNATVLSSPALGADGTLYFGTDTGPAVALGEAP